MSARRWCELLRRLGVTVDFPAGQTCCGMPLFNSGYHREAAEVAARTVELFTASGHVVVPSGSCAWMVKTEYPGLLAGRSEAGAPPRSRWPARTRELSQFLVEVLGVTQRRRRRSRGRVTYHDSCHLLRGLGESRSPRALLRGRARAWSWSSCRRGPVLRLRRLLLGAAPRGVDRHPRQEARQRRATGPTAWWPATRAVSCRWAAASRAAARACGRCTWPRCWPGEGASGERATLRDAVSRNGRARRSGTPSSRRPSRSPRRSSSISAARPSRASRRARRSATGRARSRRRRSSGSTRTSSGSPTTSSGSAATSTGRRRPRRRARSSSTSPRPAACGWR